MVGDTGSPWRTPLRISKNGDKQLLLVTQHLGLWYSILIQETRYSLNPYALKR